MLNEMDNAALSLILPMVLVVLANSMIIFSLNQLLVMSIPLPKTGKEVGIDLGIKTLATLSDRKAKTTLKL